MPEIENVEVMDTVETAKEGGNTLAYILVASLIGAAATAAALIWKKRKEAKREADPDEKLVETIDSNLTIKDKDK